MQMGIVLYPEFKFHLFLFSGQPSCNFDFLSTYECQVSHSTLFMGQAHATSFEEYEHLCNITESPYLLHKYINDRTVSTGKVHQNTYPLYTVGKRAQILILMTLLQSVLFQCANNNFLHFEDTFTFCHAAVFLNRRIKSGYL